MMLTAAQRLSGFPAVRARLRDLNDDPLQVPHSSSVVGPAGLEPAPTDLRDRSVHLLLDFD
jgi:hypothetical protein